MIYFFANLPAWITLFIAIVFEVCATSWLPKTNKFTDPLHTAIALSGYAVAFYMLSITVQSMPLGIAYAIWCGAGIIIVTGIAWLFYGQQLDFFALLGISFILVGAMIIHLFSNTGSH